MKFSYIVLVTLLRSIAAIYKQDVNLEALHPRLKSLEDYQIIKPVQYEDENHEIQLNSLETFNGETTDGHRKNVYISININGTDYKLDLSLNEDLISPSFGVTYQTEIGKSITKPPSAQTLNHCQYHGRIRNNDEAYATLSTCNGGLSGVIVFSNDELVIEPLPPSLQSHPSGNHVVYRRNDDVTALRDEDCGNDHADDLVKNFMRGFNRENRIKRDVSTERKFLQFMLVVNNKEYRRYNSIPDVETQMVSLVNLIDGLYSILGIRVIFTQLVVWSVVDEIQQSTNPQTVLEDFGNYRLNNVDIDADTVHLIFGGNFDGSTVGKASTQTICTPRAVGVNQGGERSLFSLAAIVSHELGHNFGMDHDTAECSCPDRICIMAATASFSPPRQWSSCSRDYLSATLNMGLGSCLLNVPAPNSIVGGPRCGNQIVETGEECDCGMTGQCQSTCCDPNTCQLLSGANCDDGLCCSNCQFRVSGAECRPTNGNTCDLPEFCTGVSGDCPADFFIENGMSCNNENALCYEGVCLTRDMQCESNWGDGASSGAELCYNSLNTRGDTVGNCGYGSNGFFPCIESNAMCGKLFCVGGGDSPTGFRGSGTFTFTRGSDVTECKLIVSTPTDVGLVLDGTICGNGRACINGACVPTSPTTCTDDCNQNGVCNNAGNCHCNAGWAPPSCSRSGTGGSIDSGGSLSLRATGCPILTASNQNVIIGDVQGSGAPYTTGEQVIYSCTSGEIVGTEIRTCLSTGVWTGEEPICRATTTTVTTPTIVQCPTLTATNPNVVLRNLIGSEAPYMEGEQVFYLCIEGVLEGTEIRTCLSAGSWTGSQPTCRITVEQTPPPQCPTLVATNMYVEIGNVSGSQAPYTTGEQVIYSCTSGQITGTQTRTCLESGDWTGSQPTCIVSVLMCSTLAATNPNVVLRNVQGSGAPYLEGEQVFYLCSAGEIAGSQIRTCLSTGEWTGSQPTCTVTSPGETTTCPPLIATNPNLLLRNAVGSTAPYTEGEQVVYSCLAGELIGPEVRICFSSGEWSGVQPICLEVACPSLTPLTPGIVIQNVAGSGEPFITGEQVQYSCSVGTLQGNRLRTCQSNAIWTGQDPTCSSADRKKAFYLATLMITVVSMLLNFLI